MPVPEIQTSGEDAKPDESDAEGQMTFSRTQIWLHWIIAALILGQFWLHDAVEVAFDARLDENAQDISLLALAHMLVGATVLCLTAWRLGLRLIDGVPPPEVDANFFIRFSSKLTHWTLYLLAFGMPLTGLAAWFFKSELLSEAHEYGSKLLVAVILLHILGAVFEHSIMGNDTLARMLRPGGRVHRWRTGQTGKKPAKSAPRGDL